MYIDEWSLKIAICQSKLQLSDGEQTSLRNVSSLTKRIDEKFTMIDVYLFSDIWFHVIMFWPDGGAISAKPKMIKFSMAVSFVMSYGITSLKPKQNTWG